MELNPQAAEAVEPISPNEDFTAEIQTAKRIEQEMRKVIVGQQYLVDRMLVGLLTHGHLLIEGVPGLAKTLAVKTLARSLDVDFGRVQFTPDLLPADLVGTQVFDPATSSFHPRKGPMFTNLLLADEINRAPAKVQSALLEAMEESQITIGDSTFVLDDPFMVLATQNPIEQEGTYPLAEAQVDRFMLKLKIDYPSRAEEAEILDRMMVDQEFDVQPVANSEEIRKLRAAVERIYLDEKLRGYILDLIAATRRPAEYGAGDLEHLLAFGASPRATLFLARAAKATALLAGRGYVVPEDVKMMAPDVLRHRVIPTFEAEAEEVTSDNLVQRLLDLVQIP